MKVDIDWDEVSKGDYSLPCPHPARNGNHETYCNADGKEYCRACGRRPTTSSEGES